MKVLLAGQGVFRDMLAERLTREKHEVYIISGEEDKGKLGRYVHYRFALTNERLDFSIRSILPDAIVFLGALDEAYDFKAGRKAAMAYTAGLTNLLATAAEAGAPRFVYLSSSAVYGAKHEAAVTESAQKQPDGLKALVVSEGESLCAEFQRATDLPVICLRFAEVYGTGAEEADCFAAILSSALSYTPGDKPFAPAMNKRISPVFASDAIDAVFRAVTAEKGPTGIYNVASPAVELSEVYRAVGDLTGVPAAESGPTAQDMTVDSSLFTRAYGFKAIVDLQTGLERAHRAMQRRGSAAKQQVKATQAKSKSLWSVLKPLAENLMVFAAAVAATLSASSGSMLSHVNFLVLYVIVIAITFGLFQTSMAIVLAGAFLMWQSSIGAGFFDMIIDLGTTLRILELVAAGVVCGYARDRMSTAMFEKNQELEDMQKELETINQINESNITIKRTLDDRLKNYEDSLAKIYSIVDKLNYLQPDAVFFSAVGVVMDIMNATDVSIYIVTGTSFKMSRLMAETQSSTRPHRKSIPLEELGVLTKSFEKREIFVNRDLIDNQPMMAAPIYSKGELVSIIMLWAIPFDGLSPYNVNRFFVLSQLVSSIIERAYVHSQTTSEAMCVPGTNGVLTVEAFNDIYQMHKDASRDNMTCCACLRVCPSEAAGMESKAFAQKVKGLLRSTDYVGMPEGQAEDLTVRVLLTNTNEEELKFVYTRLTDNRITVEEAIL